MLMYTLHWTSAEAFRMPLLQELKRRKVDRVGIAYLAASWVALQLADVVVENLGLPGWAFKALLSLIVIGFPIALALAWAFQLTPDGLKRDASVGEEAPPVRVGSGQYVQLAITGVLAIAVGVLVIDKFRSAANTQQAATAGLERSVVVLPFENLSAAADDRLFVDGMHDYLLTQLARLATLDKVIARPTAEAYRDTNRPLDEIADELGVATVLTGGFQRAGDKVRINMQLIRADDGSSLWANTWDRQLTLENLFATQTDISEDVVLALQGALSEQERSLLAEQPTADPAAFGEYSKGRTRLAKRTVPDLEAALAHFEAAVGIDPEFVLAWVGIADAHGLISTYGDLSVDDTIVPRRQAIDRALALDPDSGEALTALAELRVHQGDSVAAEEYFRQAIIQAPHYPRARHWYSLLLRQEGRIDSALREIRIARDTDPDAAILASAEAGILITAGDYAAADRTLVDAIKRFPDFQNLYASRGDLFLLRGHLDDALRWQDAAVRMAPTSRDAREGQCAVQAELGMLDRAESCLEALFADFPRRYIPGLSPTDLAIFAQKGEIERFLVPIEQLGPLPDGAKLGMGTAYLLANRVDEARELYETVRPDLFETPLVELKPSDITDALVVAGILDTIGETERAREMVRALERLIAESPDRALVAAFTPTILALARRDYRAAAQALPNSTETGAMNSWWIFLTPSFEIDRENLEFASALNAMTEEITRQREAYLADPELPLL